MDSFLLLEQSSVVMSGAFWLLLWGFGVYFVCCSWIRVFVSCRSMLDAVNRYSQSPWVWLDAYYIWMKFSKGWCFFGYPEPPKSIHVLASTEFLWNCKMQHLELWVCFVYESSHWRCLVGRCEQMRECDTHFSSLYSFGKASESLFFSKDVWTQNAF